MNYPAIDHIFEVKGSSKGCINIWTVFVSYSLRPVLVSHPSWFILVIWLIVSLLWGLGQVIWTKIKMFGD